MLVGRQDRAVQVKLDHRLRAPDGRDLPGIIGLLACALKGLRPVLPSPQVAFPEALVAYAQPAAAQRKVGVQREGRRPRQDGGAGIDPLDLHALQLARADPENLAHAVFHLLQGGPRRPVDPYQPEIGIQPKDIGVQAIEQTGVLFWRRSLAVFPAES